MVRTVAAIVALSLAGLGFAAGAEAMRWVSIGVCDQLIDASFWSWKKSPPSGKSSAWKRGFDDGQQLVFHLKLLSELPACTVPVPGPP
jgi:hypothetical protein